MNDTRPPEHQPTLEQRIRETLGDRYVWAMHTEPVRRLSFMIAQAEDRAANAERALQVLQDTRRPHYPPAAEEPN